MTLIIDQTQSKSCCNIISMLAQRYTASYWNDFAFLSNDFILTVVNKSRLKKKDLHAVATSLQKVIALDYSARVSDKAAAKCFSR